MAWNIDTSRDRIETIANSIPEIEISDLGRQMNFDNVTLARPKRITGVHTYVAVTNDQRLVDELLDAGDQEAAKAPVRRLHLYQREIARIVADFNAAQVHFQGSRLHALTYRPCGDHPEIVARALTMACAIDLMVRKAFNPAFPDESGFVSASGQSFGPTIATKSGSRGDAELLFIGDAANRAAKVIDPAVRIVVDGSLAGVLDVDGLGVELDDLEDGAFSATMSHEAVDAAVARYGISWSVDRSAKRIASDLEDIPLSAVNVSKATSEIDKDRLSLANTKLNDAVSMFADLDGFTAIVEAAANDDDALADLVRAFHITRAELRHVAVRDYAPTMRVQYQGDRLQALRHLPHNDPADRVLAGLRVAAGWQSSMRETIPEFVDRDDLRLAIGMASGPTALSKVGTRGNRDIVALGAGVRQAERIQRNLEGDEVGVDKAILELLPYDVAGMFQWRLSANGYVASDLRVNDLELALEAPEFDGASARRVTNRAGKVAVSATPEAAGSSAIAPEHRPNNRHHDAQPRRRWAN
jgi:hypothetical protein